MDSLEGAKEKYRLLMEKDFDDEELSEKIKEKARSFGVENVSSASKAEIILEGGNGPLTNFIIWFLESHLEKLRYLKSEE